MFFAVSTLLVALIWLLCTGAANTKLEMRHRVLHIRYVICTLVFDILSVVFFVKILDVVSWILNTTLVQNLLYILMLPGNLAAGLYWVITLLCCLVLAALYQVMMRLLRALWLKPLSERNYLETRNFVEKFLNAVAALFYVVQEGYATLSAHKYNIGRWVQTMRRGFGYMLVAEALFIGLYLQMDWTFLGVDFFAVLVKSLFMLPLLVYVLLEQVELFLAADRTKAEILTDTEEIGMVQQGNFNVLVKEYKRLFGETALIAEYQGSGKGDVQESLFSGVGNDQLEQCSDPVLLNALLRSVECVNAPMPLYVNGLVDLIDGHNVAAFDTPWGEFDPYYMAYIQHKLTLGQSALVLCDTKQQVQRMMERMKSVFTRLNVVNPIWRICDMDCQVDGQRDILVCTEEQFLANPLNEYYPDFDRRLGIVVMLDAYGLLCRESAFSSRVFHYFAERKLQYVFYVPENNTDIRYLLQKRIGCSEIRLREKSNAKSSTQLMFWRADSVYKTQQQISPRLHEDFGVAYTLGIVAGMFGVETVNVLAPESVPLQTYYHLVTQRYNTELAEDYLATKSINLSTLIRNNDYSVTEPAQLNFCIVYDEYNNLLDVAQTWLSYGGIVSSMLHVVSAPYMLRDYLACNVSTLLAETTGLQMLIPKCPLGQKVPAMALLLRMRRGVLCQDILQFAKECQIESDRLEQILGTALQLVFGQYHPYSIYHCFSFKECTTPSFDGEYHYTVKVTLIDGAMYQKLCQMTEEFVRLPGMETEMLPIHKLDVYNHFLPRQQVSFGGHRYRIDAMSGTEVQLSPEGTVVAELCYTPVYEIAGLTRNDTPMQPVPKNDKVIMHYFEAAVTRKTTGYFAHPGMLDLAHKETTHLETFAEPIVETKTVPCLELTFRYPLKDRAEKVANTLCFLLKGAMATFLPKNHKDLLVFSRLDMDQVRSGVAFKKPTAYLPDPIPSDMQSQFDLEEDIDPDICKLIPQVADEADVKPNTAEEIYIYIAQFSVLDTGALTAIAEDLDRILDTVLKYLRWSGTQQPGKPEYLRFGYGDVPGIFNPTDTAICLPNYFDYVPESTGRRAGEPDLSGEGAECCSFCGRPVSVSYTKIADGRIMCPECRKHVTDSRAEINVMLKEAEKLIEGYYGVTLPEGIKVKFKSASAIRKHTGVVGGRVLGFYNLRKREIWVERKGPEPCVFSTLVHELTHAWQHENINMNVDLKFLEGHTSFVEVECTKVRGQGVYAQFQDRCLMRAQDEYGEGYRYWKAVISNDSDKNIFHHVLEKLPKR